MQRAKRDCDDSISFVSTTTNSSTGSSVQTLRRRGRKPKNNVGSYKFDSCFIEDHRIVIYSVSFNHYLEHDQIPIFATVGSNRSTVFECPKDSGIRLLLCYADPDPEEAFYTCAWTYRRRGRKPLLAIGGQRGVIRIIDIGQHKSICNLIGHGGAINQLKVHPIHAFLLLSCSKDYSVRLWNIETHVLIAIFSGVGGHRAEVLSIDFDISGERIMSCGMDHALKLWQLNTNELQTAIKSSTRYFAEHAMSLSFPTVKQHYPNFSSRDIHGNYVDCVQWFGDFIISKSCQNSIVIWKIGEATIKQAPKKRRSPTDTIDIIAQFKCQYCELWFVRFDFNIWRHMLAVGNQYGTIYVWELSSDGPQQTYSYKLTTRDCNRNIRDVAFSKNAGVLIAVCDDGTIWRWNRSKQ